MKTKLIQLQQRISELETLAAEVLSLGKRLSCAQSVQPALSVFIFHFFIIVRALAVAC